MRHRGSCSGSKTCFATLLRSDAPFVPLFALLIYSFGVAGDWRHGDRRSRVHGASCAAGGEQHREKLPEPGKTTPWLLQLPISMDAYRLFPLSATADPHARNSCGALFQRGGVRLIRRLEELVARLIGVRVSVGTLRLIFILRRHRDTDRNQDSFLVYDPTLARCVPCPLPRWAFIFHGVAGKFLSGDCCRNFLTRTFRNPWAGLAVASAILAALSHILHAPYPGKIRDAGNGRGIILWARVDEDALAAAGDVDSCASGYFVAFVVSVEAGRDDEQGFLTGKRRSES